MKKLWKTLAVLLALALVCSLLTAAVFALGDDEEESAAAEEPETIETEPGAGGAEEQDGPEAEAPELLFCGEGERLSVTEGAVVVSAGGVVYNNGATVYNNGGIVYNNFGTVYHNAGKTFNNSGLVYVNGGIVYNNDGVFVYNDGELHDNRVPPAEVEEESAEEPAEAEEEPAEAAEEPAEAEEEPAEAEEEPAEAAEEPAEAEEESAEAEEELDEGEEAPLTLEADLTSGVCVPGQELTLSSEAGAAIYYTLDGSEPDEESTLYTEPLVLERSVTLRARAYAAGREPSELLEADYTVPLATAPVFDVLDTQYWRGGLPEAALTLENDGTQPFTVKAARLNGPDSLCFTLAWEKDVTLAPGETDSTSWVISPNRYLAAREYTARLVLILESGESFSVPFTLTVVKA